MKWTPAIITAILASYGWWLVVEHAKFREASGLDASVISRRNRIASQGKEAWEKNSNKLDQHTELKFLLNLEAVEQLLGILKSHYRNLGKSISDLRSQITRLMHFLTAVPFAFGITQWVIPGQGLKPAVHIALRPMLRPPFKDRGI